MNRRGFLAALIGVPVAGVAVWGYSSPLLYGLVGTWNIHTVTHLYDSTSTEVAIWNRCLTHEEIEYLMKDAMPGCSVWLEDVTV